MIRLATTSPAIRPPYLTEDSEPASCLQAAYFPPLSALSLYPNPAHHRILVQVPPVPSAFHATLTLTNALGQPVRTHTAVLPVSGLRQELNLTGLVPGFYALRVQVGTATATCRLVVE